MTKKGVRVVICGQPRPVIDIAAMTNIIIALGREMAEGERVGQELAMAACKVAGP